MTTPTPQAASRRGTPAGPVAGLPAVVALEDATVPRVSADLVAVRPRADG